MQPGMCPSFSWSSTSLWRMPCMSLRSSSCGRSWSAPTLRATGSDCPPGFLSVSLCVCSSSSLAPAAPDQSGIICIVAFVLDLCHTSLCCCEHSSCAILSVKFAFCTSLRAALTSACCVCSVVHLVHSLAHPILQVSTLSLCNAPSCCITF